MVTLWKRIEYIREPLLCKQKRAELARHAIVVASLPMDITIQKGVQERLQQFTYHLSDLLPGMRRPVNTSRNRACALRVLIEKHLQDKTRSRAITQLGRIGCIGTAGKNRKEECLSIFRELI
ncbi:hypothetical protein Y032_0023g805 [Ancylostoma ceylanicum]|uniref:Uncharacterized protein n=1 Tax=Ancylostoma ceylanicum TaxID=53326 RepID=A0A016UY76_9BILA|nr:hypothetical protein Y032_0023g805 [Ancylostoma ceylanicum]